MEQVGFNAWLDCSKQVLWRGVHIPYSTGYVLVCVCVCMCGTLWFVYVCLEEEILFVFVWGGVCICVSVSQWVFKGSVIGPEGKGKWREKHRAKLQRGGLYRTRAIYPRSLLHPISAPTPPVKPHQTDTWRHKGKPHLHGKLIRRCAL